MTDEANQEERRKKDILGKSNQELVDFIFKTTPQHRDPAMAQAELARRQMEAIRNFNHSSTLWSKRLYWLTITIGGIAALQLFNASSRHAETTKSSLREEASRSVPNSKDAWKQYKDQVVFALANREGIKVLSIADGNFRSDAAEEFWDGILEIHGIRVGLDIRTGSQNWFGFTGSLSEQKHYLIRLSHMAGKLSLVPFIVTDTDVLASSGGANLLILMEMLNNSTGMQPVKYVYGSPDEVMEKIVRVIEEGN